MTAPRKRTQTIDSRQKLITQAEKLIIQTLRLARMFHLDKIPPFINSASVHPFTDYFKGFEKVETIRQIFGDRTEEVLRSLKVDFTWMGGYMWVNESNGHLMVNPDYLRRGDKLDIYLDIIHELIHIRQLMEGKSLFDGSYRYVERPTEVEAYRYAVEEAKRLGLSNERICQYLKTEWMSEDDLRQLAKTLGIECHSLDSEN